MGQVTIYLEDSVEQKMVAAAKSANLSKSKWISGIIEEKVSTEWPQSIVDLVGCWNEFPDARELRQELVEDSKRDTF